MTTPDAPDESAATVVPLRPDVSTGPPSDNGRLLLTFGSICAALLAVLVGLTIYGFLIKKPADVQLSIPRGEPPTTQVPGDPGSTGGRSAPSTAPAPNLAAGPTADATDGPLSFKVHGIDVGTTVATTDSSLEKTAAGEYIVVHMTVTNVGTDPSSFIGMFQTLHAGDARYSPDNEATAYLEGATVSLEPGASADVSIAFDVPTGTAGDAIELHADPSTPGAEVPLA
jgi:hypothetical protein